MASVESRSGVRDAAFEPPVDRLLQCIAGFYDSQAQALAAIQQLETEHRLKPSNVLLLGPKDASPARFAWQARQWTGRWSMEKRRAGDMGMSALLGALLAGGLASLWLVMALGAPVELSPVWWRPVGWLAAASLAGAAAGAGGVALADRTSRPRVFDSNVRRQLSAGKWAVVAHGVPDASQAGVVGLLRASDRHWVAVAKPLQRL